MNDNLSNALAELARKLGTTADHLYPVMIKQVVLDATVDLYLSIAWIAFFFLILVALGVRIWYCIRKKNDDSPIVSIVCGIFAGCFFIVHLLVFSFSSLPDYYKCKQNPEYYAAREMARLVK